MLKLLIRWSSAYTRARNRYVLFHRIFAQQRGQSGRWHWWRWRLGATTSQFLPLMGLSWMTTFKSLFGQPPVKLDNDPLKQKIKEAWLLRKYQKYDEAIDALNEAMRLAKERDEMAVSRVFDELANCYYQMGRINEAEEEFKSLLQRLITLHGKKDSDPEFIEVSLKLADIYARRGRIDEAEIGYKHCVSRQMKTVENHMAKFALRSSGHTDIPHIVEEFGATFTDPLALFGMCLEQYAHFLVIHCDESRLDDSAQLMDEALKVSHQVYGIHCFHTINMLNNYGAILILYNRFELAKKYLEIGINRILYVDECSSILPGYYCNYAEALYHCGQREEALSYAKKAVEFARSESSDVQKHANNFLGDIERDFRRKRS